ncbi:MAG: hypothetical protein KDK63_03510 [Chlamydiia bacterium]|nr:hypothetical protein [Chlamydiia bacterium]
MKKWLSVFVLLATFSFASEKEDKGQELCSFTSEVFTILEDQSKIIEPSHLAKAHAESIKKLQVFEKGNSPELAKLAERFIVSMQGGDNGKEGLGDAVSSLGCLVKCSVDDDYYRLDTPFVLHKKDIQNSLSLMERRLGDRLPKDKKVSYHKMMIESLAEQKYDIALYAYFKIAEERCQTS